MLSLSSAALLYEPDSGDILFWHIRAMYKLGSLDLTQKYLAQHAEKLSEEQKTVLECISGSIMKLLGIFSPAFYRAALTSAILRSFAVIRGKF